MLSDKEIIDGFRHGDPIIFKQYFYEYCRTAYNTFDKKYNLRKKENLDFMSLAHQYAIFLMEHDWKPLEDHSPSVSLRTWMVNGFRYVVLDALKWYKKEYGTITFNDYLKSFDTSQDLRLNFNKVIREICDSSHLDPKSRDILLMLLVEGYKTKEVAERLGITSSAVSQRYNTLKKNLVIPYFKHNFDMDFDMPKVMMDMPEDRSLILHSCIQKPMDMPESIASIVSRKKMFRDFDSEKEQNMPPMEKKRTTRGYIRELAPGEIFVFGSNLRGIHACGTARIAHLQFGAIMGQGKGLQGSSYAIPAMQGGVDTIKPYVDEFIGFAKEHLELTFLVTRIGCGIAGFTDEQIAPLFAAARQVENIFLPMGW